MAKPTRYTQELIDDYTRKGYFTSTTFADLWDKNALEYGNREAIVDSKSRITWAQAKVYTDRLALGLLELGFKKDDVIFIQLPNWAELVLLKVACEKAGVISLLARRSLRAKDVEYMLNYAEVPAVVIPWKYGERNYFEEIMEMRSNLPHLKHILVCGDKAPQGTTSIKEMMSSPLEKKYPPAYLEKTKYNAYEVWWLAHTTGTTGLPKFAEFTICARVCSGREFAKLFRVTTDDILNLFAPAAAGPNTLAYFCAPVVGTKVVISDRFDAGEALRLIEQEKITVLGVVPTHLALMLRHPDFGKYDLSSLRIIMCNSAPLPYSLARDCETLMGARVINGYSTMDISQVISGGPDDPPDVRWATVGKPFGGGELRIADENDAEVPKGTVGEIQLRGPFCSSGYYNDPELTRKAWTADGWFKTGDLGLIDENDNLVPVGRKKDMIIRGGENIYPVEIENILITHPKIANVAIVGMPDPTMGERCCAYVVLKQGEQFSLSEMVDFLKQNKVTSFKIPERLEVVDELPMVGETKVDRIKLQRDIAEKLKAQGKIG